MQFSPLRTTNTTGKARIKKRQQQTVRLWLSIDTSFKIRPKKDHCVGPWTAQKYEFPASRHAACKNTRIVQGTAGDKREFTAQIPKIILLKICFEVKISVIAKTAVQNAMMLFLKRKI